MTTERAPPRRTAVLRVDLTDGTVKREPIPEQWLRQYIGGKGLGARYLHEVTEPGVDPLAPGNALLFMVGPLSGLIPGEPRYAAITKSPLTGTFLDSYSGGDFAARLAGSLGETMGLIVTGQAPEPVSLVVSDGDVSIEPATAWGEGVEAACEAHPDAAVACTGPAGENEVVYATIASDGGDHHAGRGGAGAVMGSKRLKAVIAVDEPVSGLDELRTEYEERFGDGSTDDWHRASETVESVDFADEIGALSTRGWQESTFEGTDEIGIEAVEATDYEREHEGEAIPGGFRVSFEENESTPRGGTQMTLGAGLGIDDFEDVATLGLTCDRLGVDIIGVGNAIAWAIRAGEEGVIDYAGEFGDIESAIELAEAIAARETELGATLADGIDAAAEAYGGEDLIPTVKGMELPSYDPRRAPSMALAYATSDRGACHRRARPIETAVFEPDLDEPTRRAREVIAEQDYRSLLWSLIADDFTETLYTRDFGAEWLAAVGLELTPTALRRAGTRIWTLTRLFNVREGFDRDDDTLPPVLEEPITDGPGAGDQISQSEFEAMRSAYYEQRGWDERGVPTRETLDALDLGALFPSVNRA
ncbi:aldehyde ferredoxin oxidoreductase [Halodesulfurarchaeum formicicum]|uniref:Aldehyde ferredoxin oxidoreductase n=1 Tax=Halodesulfurarchaeum formicicum TaxID=1873524 RepID=A0A1D8S6E1_9EURY|nr:aldehyde ferredoxin oxidoreductase C-terminal domain-containing protein [Halodesulfurarchaeum formicicum]AOW80920.1 aldehyde ferredoxin oxidoreductase [Halodesulfurarchaeum formicicum]